MGGWTYQPVFNGQRIDPVDNGGVVTSLVLYSVPARTGAIAATVGPAVKIGPGKYRFDMPVLAPNRYWGIVTFTPGTAMAAVTDNVRVDLPTGTGLITSPESVATLLGKALPLTDAEREIFIEGILDAQADVENALNRPLIPTAYVIEDAQPGTAIDLWDWLAWEPYARTNFYDIVTVTGWVGPDGDGRYVLSISVGLDVTLTSLPHAISRYVVAHAAETLRNNPNLGFGSRNVRSLSAEGQSISYVDVPTGGSGTGGGGNAGAKAGALPTLASLARWKRPAIYVSPRLADAVWPYNGRSVPGLRFL